MAAIILDTVNSTLNWNGRTHYYQSPTGRRTSRIIRTSKKDFNITVNRLSEIIRPEAILVSSYFAPEVQQNVLGIINKKMCAKCGNIFKPLNWSGWSKKYLSIFNVYNCEKCNLKLQELDEKDIERAMIVKYIIRRLFIIFSVLKF